MKTFEITKEQILQLNSYNNYDCGVALKQWFPQAFESELKVGKWYKSNLFEEKLYCFTKFEQCDGYIRRYYYGFSEGNFREDYTASSQLDNSWTPATDKEVETALIAEAKRRGFKEGVKFNVDWETYGKGKGIMQNSIFKLNNNSFGFQTLCQIGQPWIFCNGKWAEIISKPIELTLEQIAEKFNVNVEQLKIKK